jgi:type II secretory pathway pseudopilin PulG
MIHNHPRRHALTLTEVLIVVGLVALVVGLLLPFLRRMRDSAVCTRCDNNLKQIVLAVHSYADTHGGKLPPLSSAPTHRGRASPQSLFFTILPFLGYERMHNEGMEFAATPGLTWTGQVGSGPIWSDGFVEAYVCPADPTNSLTQPTALGWAGCSYGANYQVFGANNWDALPLSGIVDGTSNTLFIVERFAQFPGPAGQFTDPDGTVCHANTLWAWPANSGTSPPTASTTAVPQNAALFAYHNRSQAGQGYGEVVYSRPQIGITPAQADYRLVQSAHRKTIEVGLGDGSARRVSSDVGQRMWQWAINPDDGIPISSDW